MIVVAKLVKLATDDGLCVMGPDVPLGRLYRVETNSIKEAILMHESGVIHCKKLIDTYPDGRWLPLDMLELGEAP